MDTLRILLITHGLPPESVGGVEQHVDGLATALRSRGHHVEIFARSSQPGPQGSFGHEMWNGIRVTRVAYRWEELQGPLDMYAQPAMDAALGQFLDSRRLAGHAFDVAHIHHLTGLSTGFPAVLHEREVAVVMTLHDYWMMCPRGQMWHREEYACAQIDPHACAQCLGPALGHWWTPDTGPSRVAEIHALCRKTLHSVDRLLTPSPRTIPFFSGLGLDERRIHVVENGVDTQGLADVAPPRLEGPLRVGYLGTLIPSKGLDVLIAAFLEAFPAPTAGSEPDATLSIHGNYAPYHGDEGFRDRAFASVPDGAPITDHGPYTTADLPRLFAEIDVLVAPALWHEAFGLTVREAQAAGRPVIVSGIGGLQDAVEDGVQGYVVPPGDRSALANRLAALAADRRRVQSMGTAARGRTRGFLAMTDDLLRHYRTAAKLDPGTSKT